MGYNLHITRQPNEGWRAWTSANAPADFAQRIAEAERDGDYDTVFDLEKELELLLAPKKISDRLVIGEEEWVAAVESIPGIRIAHRNPSFTNPRTGDVITIRNSEKSVEVLDASGNWHMGIHFSKGRVTLSGVAWEAGNPIGEAASQLAAKLDAKIIGDEGEHYPLVPGSAGHTKDDLDVSSP